MEKAIIESGQLVTEPTITTLSSQSKLTKGMAGISNESGGAKKDNSSEILQMMQGHNPINSEENESDDTNSTETTETKLIQRLEALVDFEDHKNDQCNDKGCKENISHKQLEDKENANPIRNKPSACVFVASLCATKTDDDLCRSVTHHFKQFGELSSVKVLRDTSNRPYAFVQYTNDTDSLQAIKLGHKSELDGRTLRCEAAKVNRTLFINFKQLLTKVEVENILEKFGQIEGTSRSNSFGKVYGHSQLKNKYWFIKYVYRDDAIRAFANLTNDSPYIVEWAQNIDNRVKKFEHVHGGEAEKLGPIFDKYSVFIGQLQNETNELELTKRFQQHGQIESINLFKKPGNNFAFIKFTKEEAAARAVELENHSMFHDKTIHVQYREFHNAKGPRKHRDIGVALAPAPINSFKKSSKFGNERKNSFSASFKPNTFRTNSYHKVNAESNFNFRARSKGEKGKVQFKNKEYSESEFYYVPTDYGARGAPYYDYYPTYFQQYNYDYNVGSNNVATESSGGSFGPYAYPNSIYSSSEVGYNSVNSTFSKNNKPDAEDNKKAGIKQKMPLISHNIN